MLGIYQLIDSALVQELKFDAVSNNLANINTNAFKKDVISFNRMLTLRNISTIDLTPGPVRYTGNQLDIALETPGFFEVRTSEGIRYTRDGSFTINEEGLLVNQNGDHIMGDNGTIQITGERVTIERDGRVISENSLAGKIVVVDFDEPSLLVKEGRSYYLYKGEKKDIRPAEEIQIQQGYLEGSNVNLTEEMIKMVETMRAYESVQKAVQSIDEMNSKMVNDAGLLQ
ncbi:MAG: flagellar hook-basal body protein [Deltaproteobacteria bacterium]|nr:flagellar hook-basal body protein [Deltaproteobacteria bacterium]MBW2139277.1 flagellar hook-basal body protein [Deltaproteobacteria bacterium]